jgi:cystathionine beta-lyase/cystathionine gamma-synthase
VSRRSRDADPTGGGTARSTRAVHAGEEAARSPRRAAGGTVHHGSVFHFDSSAELEDAFEHGGHQALYSRMGNPTVRVVEEKLAALEGARELGDQGGDAIAFASGMGAIAGTLDALVASGDRLVAARELYGGTHAWIERLGRRHPGVTVERLPGAEIAERLDATGSEPPTVVFVETPTNPLLSTVSLEPLAAACRRRGARLVVDSTFATPILQNPLALGAHVVVHSATKALAGHSDVSAGAAVAAEGEVAERIREAMILGGACLDPHAAFLVARGMKTLEIRVERASANAAYLAHVLERHPRVARVHYPTPDPAQMRSGGPMLSFEVDGGLAAARAFADRLELVAILPSLGGVETGVSLPAASSHRRMSPAERRAIGIEDSLVRLSCGIEGSQDLERDLVRALAG